MSPSTASHSPSRWTLRRCLVARRAALPRAVRLTAERRITALIARSSWLRPGVSVGLYVSRGAEVDTSPLRALAARRGSRVYLPRIVNYRTPRMEFAADRGARLRPNRFHIGEPLAAAGIGARALAVVLLPVVGFDGAGHRLGSGAGYYDRLLAFRRHTAGAPLLVGIAFECQRCRGLDPAPHDVPLDAVVTEAGIQYFARRR